MTDPITNPIDETSVAKAGPTPARAVVCLLLNLIVFPGLGTLISGDRTRRRTGFLQLGFGAGLIPFMILVGIGAMKVGGTDPEVAKAWLSNFMMVLVVWNVVTGAQIFRDSWKRARAREVAAGPGASV
jgi:hypothetical protein